MPIQPPLHVLFVCLGNICRSPMAEAVFRHKVEQSGLTDSIVVDSAGTGNWHVGSSPHPGTRRILARQGISTEGMAARQIEPADLDAFDYILTMDANNLANVQRMAGSAPRAVLKPLLEYAPHLGIADVPDPYYSGGYEEVYRLIDAASDGLLAAIRRDHNL